MSEAEDSETGKRIAPLAGFVFGICFCFCLILKIHALPRLHRHTSRRAYHELICDPYSARQSTQDVMSSVPGRPGMARSPWPKCARMPLPVRQTVRRGHASSGVSCHLAACFPIPPGCVGLFLLLLLEQIAVLGEARISVVLRDAARTAAATHTGRHDVRAAAGVSGADFKCMHLRALAATQQREKTARAQVLARSLRCRQKLPALAQAHKRARHALQHDCSGIRAVPRTESRR